MKSTRKKEYLYVNKEILLCMYNLGGFSIYGFERTSSYN
jgi:hypothetical protein